MTMSNSKPMPIPVSKSLRSRVQALHLEQYGVQNIPELLIQGELEHPLAISVRKQQQQLLRAGLVLLCVVHAASQMGIVHCLPLWRPKLLSQVFNRFLQAVLQPCQRAPKPLNAGIAPLVLLDSHQIA